MDMFDHILLLSPSADKMKIPHVKKDNIITVYSLDWIYQKIELISQQ